MIDSAAQGDISGGQMECQQRIERELVIDINRFKPHHFEYLQCKTEDRAFCNFLFSIYFRLDVHCTGSRTFIKRRHI